MLQVFYLEEAVTVKKNEAMTGTFAVMPNKRNERDLDFAVAVQFHGELSDLEEKNTYTMH